jgi:hypothetical protein
VPPAAELHRFMAASEEAGATAVSFWVWQSADQQAWDAIKVAHEFQLPAGVPLSIAQTRAYQTLLTSLGYPVPVTGLWDPATVEALHAYQRAARLPTTGVLDDATRASLLKPVPPPLL